VTSSAPVYGIDAYAANSGTTPVSWFIAGNVINTYGTPMAAQDFFVIQGYGARLTLAANRMIASQWTNGLAQFVKTDTYSPLCVIGGSTGTMFFNLPTSNAALSTGGLWSNGGVLTIK
jgi:hypothetical protein